MTATNTVPRSAAHPMSRRALTEGPPPSKSAAPLVVGLLALPAHDGRTPLHLQLFRRIRDLVVAGALSPGAKLPSTRSLAAGLGISRNSVLSAYDQLQADGWIKTRHGSGAYVSSQRPARQTAPLLLAIEPRFAPAFEVGIPAVDLFPSGVWSRLQGRVWRNMAVRSLGADPGLGLMELRRAIAAHLAISRGLICAPEQVVVTTGARASLAIALSALRLQGRAVAIEDPTYAGVLALLRRLGCLICAAPVDGEGVDIVRAVGGEMAAAAYVTPACQYPTGVELSLPRRKALLGWAMAGEKWLLEDDYDCEVVAGPRPVAPLAAMAPQRTVYLNSFNKTLFPALRIGYLVSPAATVDAFAAAGAELGGGPGLAEQMALTAFLESGHFDVHLRRAREACAERREVMRDLIASRLSPWFDATDGASGAHLLAWLRVGDEAQTVASAAGAQVRLTGVGGALGPSGCRTAAVLFGFAGFRPALLRRSAEVLGRTLQASPR